MRLKIIEAIKSFYLSRFDEYQMSPEEIAELVCKVVDEQLNKFYISGIGCLCFREKGKRAIVIDDMEEFRRKLEE